MGADAVGGEFQRLDRRPVGLIDSLIDFGGADRHGFGAERQAIELLGQVDHRRIAARPYIGKDRRNRG